MTWTAPAPPPFGGSLVADERTLLEGFLDWQRAVLAGKCTGLTGEDLARREVPPSSLSLLGLIRHLTSVEHEWFQCRFRQRPIVRKHDAFDGADPAGAEADYAALVAEWNRSRNTVQGADLDTVFVDPQRGQMSLRAMYLHLIQEYARHNGHADLLRERIDGAVG